MLLCKCRSQKTEREIEALAAVFLPKLLCKVAWLTLHLWLPSKKVTEEGRKEGADTQLPLETAAAQNTTETAKKAQNTIETSHRDDQDSSTNPFQHPLRPLVCLPRSGR